MYSYSEPSRSDPAKHDGGLLVRRHVRRIPGQVGALPEEVAVPDEGALPEQRGGDEELFDQATRAAQGVVLFY